MDKGLANLAEEWVAALIDKPTPDNILRIKEIQSKIAALDKSDYEFVTVWGRDLWQQVTSRRLEDSLHE